MTGEQIKLLAQMKRLIRNGKRRFAAREDRNYSQELVAIGITEYEAWKEILTLSSINYVFDYKPFYAKSKNTLTFKKVIEGVLVYIKLTIEEYNSEKETVCLSFHIDYR